MTPEGEVIVGDCLDVMAKWPEASVDAIVTDPPYGLEFMGKEWDRLLHVPADTPRVGPDRNGFLNSDGRQRVRYEAGGAAQAWHHRWATEAFRIAKPSAYLLAFGGTRTVHRLTCALEDAGWIIRDLLVWAYASGFPKSKASLKPAWEPIVMARKPGPLRMLAIDECRIGITNGELLRTSNSPKGAMPGDERDGAALGMFNGVPHPSPQSPLGRWPANVILTDPIFDGDTEGVVGGGEAGSVVKFAQAGNIDGKARTGGSGDGVTLGISGPKEALSSYGDSGTYSRFFLIPKADRADREPVLGGLPERPLPIGVERHKANYTRKDGGPPTRVPRANVHPTVKPTELMRHLVRLVTPAGGLVLDPFLGSGTTALAAEQEGFRWVGIEREPEYAEIARARLNGTQRGLGLDVPAPTPRYTTPPDSKMPPMRKAGRAPFDTMGRDKGEGLDIA